MIIYEHLTKLKMLYNIGMVLIDFFCQVKGCIKKMQETLIYKGFYGVESYCVVVLSKIGYIIVSYNLQILGVYQRFRGLADEQ